MSSGAEGSFAAIVETKVEIERWAGTDDEFLAVSAEISSYVEAALVQGLYLDEIREDLSLRYLGRFHEFFISPLTARNEVERFVVFAVATVDGGPLMDVRIEIRGAEHRSCASDAWLIAVRDEIHGHIEGARGMGLSWSEIEEDIRQHHSSILSYVSLVEIDGSDRSVVEFCACMKGD